MYRTSQHTKPKIDIIYRRSDYHGPFPDESAGQIGEVISSQGTGTISKIAPGLVLKHGNFVRVAEAKALLFIEENAPAIPVPRVHACYTIGPYERDIGDYGPRFDNYIIMDFIPGTTLESRWNDLTVLQKAKIASELREFFEILRSLREDDVSYIGSIHRGPLTDVLFDSAISKGPFVNETDFNECLVRLYEKALPRANMGFVIAGALAQQRQHAIAFTHGDLRGNNVMIDGDRVVGVVDWEMSGFYPEYWEFVKAFEVAGWPSDWPEFVTQVLNPYFTELAVHDMIKRDIW